MAESIAGQNPKLVKESKSVQIIIIEKWSRSR